MQEIETGLTVGYSTRLADVDGDGKRDILVLDSRRVLWYRNPTWRRHVILDGHTLPDNVCFAAHDVNGDGKLDLAIGADWHFGPKNVGSIHWLEQTAPDKPWNLHPLGAAPFVHRMAWEDVNGDSKPQLVVVPLLGSGPNQPARQAATVPITAFGIPAKPATERWKEIVLDRSLHVSHNFLFADFENRGRRDLVVASFEGLTRFERAGEIWKGVRIAEGDQQSRPNRGCSEVAWTRLKTGAAFATIEPWHGDKGVVYRSENGSTDKLARTVVDADLKWGHAVAWADLDGDGEAELVAGVRDDQSPTARRGVRFYRRAAEDSWRRTLVDPGGVAVEDLVAGDLDGDGKVDLVAAGRQTHNVRIYWNQSERAAGR